MIIGGQSYQGVTSFRSGAAGLSQTQSLYFPTDLAWGGGVKQPPIMLLNGRIAGLSGSVTSATR